MFVCSKHRNFVLVTIRGATDGARFVDSVVVFVPHLRRLVLFGNTVPTLACWAKLRGSSDAQKSQALRVITVWLSWSDEWLEQKKHSNTHTSLEHRWDDLASAKGGSVSTLVPVNGINGVHRRLQRNVTDVFGQRRMLACLGRGVNDAPSC
jgi:hypothetical protein